MYNFNNKVVVITGAASGMGRGYALAFAKLGSRLALCDFDSAGLAETESLVAKMSTPETLSMVFDISEQAACLEFADLVKSELGGVDILINNAGIEGSAKPVWATSEQSFRRVMDVNYYGVVNGTRAFLPQMLAANQGVIVNVSSIFGLAGTPNHADYCASKFAVRGFTEALMVELIDSPIQVHSMHPGGIATNIARQSRSKDFASHFLKTTPDDIAQHLIHCIKCNRPRIVFGHGARKTWLGVRLLPLTLLCRLIWTELKGVIDQDDYSVGQNLLAPDLLDGNEKSELDANKKAGA